MSTTTTRLGLFKYDSSTDGAQTFSIGTALNENWDKVDEAISGIAAPGTAKTTPADADSLALADSADSGKTKKLLWSALKTALGFASGVLSAAKGGTGCTTLQATRSAMGLGNTTGALPVTNGGTGSTTEASALYALMNALASATPATGDKIPLVDISAGTASYATVANLLASAPKIASGYYTGTGTYGSTSPTTVVLGFVPKIMFIFGYVTSSGNTGTSGIFINSGLSAPILFNGSSIYKSSRPTITWGSTMSWYSSAGSYDQLNDSDKTYIYYAIG